MGRDFLSAANAAAYSGPTQSRVVVTDDHPVVYALESSANEQSDLDSL
jgi:hypothetical protein